MQRVSLFYPGNKFPSLSVTGSQCQLRCNHCGGHYLKQMVGIHSPEELIQETEELESAGATGFLLSGGCLPDGRIPLPPYTEAIGEIKQKSCLMVNVHPGMIGESEAKELIAAGVDAFSVDFLVERDALEALHDLRLTPDDYVKNLARLDTLSAPRLTPHLCLGLPGATPEGECRAIDRLAPFHLSSLVLLLFIPTPGTPHESEDPPSHGRVLRVLDRALDRLDCPVLLGCMRPRGDFELEMKCVQHGISGVAVPSRRLVAWLEEEGYHAEKRELCCAFYL